MQPAAELPAGPGLREDVGDAASGVTRRYFAVCLYTKIANMETSCLKALDALTSRPQRAQAVVAGGGQRGSGADFWVWMLVPALPGSCAESALCGATL